LINLDSISWSTDYSMQQNIIDGDMGIEYEYFEGTQGGEVVVDLDVKLYSSIFGSTGAYITDAPVNFNERTGRGVGANIPFAIDKEDFDQIASTTAVYDAEWDVIRGTDIRYPSAEATNLRERFSAPEGSTFASLIDDTITTIMKSVDLSLIEQTHNRRIYTTKLITEADLFALAGEEGAQDISVSLTTVTGSAGVTSTSTYSGGGGYS